LREAEARGSLSAQGQLGILGILVSKKKKTNKQTNKQTKPHRPVWWKKSLFASFRNYSLCQVDKK